MQRSGTERGGVLLLRPLRRTPKDGRSASRLNLLTLDTHSAHSVSLAFNRPHPALMSGLACVLDMLSHAFRGNYEAAVLIAGDADYVPLVEEVKRLGKNVYRSFFEFHGLSPELRRSVDSFSDITAQLVQSWKPARR